MAQDEATTIRRGEGLLTVSLRRMRDWVSDPEDALFLALILLYLIPIWAFHYFPSQDGPSHVDNAVILSRLPSPGHSVFHEYYALNLTLSPAWFRQIVLALLVSILPPLVSEKLFLSAYVILLPVSVRYALRGADQDKRFLSILSFPFVLSYTLHMGFYDFQYSVVIFFFMLGYWLRHQGSFTVRNGAVSVVLSLVLYFTHIMSLVMSCIATVVLASFLTARDVVQAHRGENMSAQGLWCRLRSQAAIPLVALLPAGALAALYMMRASSRPPSFGPALTKYRWLQLYRPDSLISFGGEELLAHGVFWLFAVLLAHLIVSGSRSSLAQRGGLLVFAGVCLVLYFVAPFDMFGGGWIVSRLNLYFFLVMIVAFSAGHYGRLARTGIQLAGAAVSGGLLVVHMSNYAGLNSYIGEYMSGIHLIDSNRTLLPLCFAPRAPVVNGRTASPKVGVFVHTAGYIGALRHVVEFTNYEANSAVLPVRFRSGLNPYRHMGRVEGEASAPSVDILMYERATGGRVDYVLTWGLGQEQVQQDEAQAVLRQLDQAYDLIHTSAGSGLMRLYRRKSSAWSLQSVGATTP